MLVEGATEKPSLEGVVDLSNTKDTMVIETIAPGTYTPMAPYCLGHNVDFHEQL